MTKQNIQYLSVKARDELWANVTENLERYRTDGFEDLQDKFGWNIELSHTYDPEPIQALVKESGPEAEIQNSLLVWKSLSHLPSSIATEDRIWARMCHLDGLEYAKARWLDFKKDEDAIVMDIKTHFFGSTLTRYRDDNAISRLWWNAYIAWLAMPDNHEEALAVLLEKADIRSGIVERTQIFSRPNVAACSLEFMVKDDWVREKEAHWRAFFRTINKFGGGVLFEAMDKSSIYEFMQKCSSEAKKSLAV